MQLVVERVQDAGELVDRADADIVGEDLRRVRAARFDIDAPARVAAPRGERRLRIVRAVLQADRDIRSFRRCDERGARGLPRRPSSPS